MDRPRDAARARGARVSRRERRAVQGAVRDQEQGRTGCLVRAHQPRESAQPDADRRARGGARPNP